MLAGRVRGLIRLSGAPRSLQHGWSRRNCSCRLLNAAASTQYAEDHHTFLSEVAMLNRTEDIPLFLRTLEAQGFASVPSYSTHGLHPYAIAMAEGSLSIWGEAAQGVLCILRWPEPDQCPNMEMPIVFMKRGDRSMRLVARSAREYVTRVLVDEDLASGQGAIAEQLGESAAQLYTPGDAAAAVKPEAFMVKEVGHFPDVSARLAQSHSDKGDDTSAMITCEWTMKKQFFPRWAFAFEQAAALYASLDRMEEARDTARLALKQPWWSVSDLPRVRELAQMTGTVEETYALFEQETRGNGQYAAPEDLPTAEETAAKKAKMLLDQVAAGEVSSWDEVRPELVARLQQAGHANAAAFIEASTRMSAKSGLTQ